MSTDSIRVLYVDDDPDTKDTVTTSLEREDERIRVETASSAKEGLEMLDNHNFDCIVSDYNLADKNGIELLKTIREDYPNLPVILYTENGNEELASKAISAGVTDYIKKESTQYELLANKITEHYENTRKEHKYKSQLKAIETAQEGISILDGDGNFIYVNQAYADLYGYEPDEMIGEHWELIYRDGDVEKIQEEILPTVKKEGFWRGETVGLRSDGTTFIEDHTLSMTDEGKLVCTIRDITQEIESERRFETLVSNLPGMVYRCKNEPDWSMEFVSQGVKELTGYTSNQLEEGEVVWGEDIIHPEDRERVWRLVQEAIGRHEPFKIEYRIITKDGEEKRVWEQGRRVSSSDSDTELLEGFIMDVTSEKEQQMELYLKERAMDESPMGITITEDTTEEGDNPIIYVNEGFEKLTGYPAEEVIGRDCRFLQGDETISEPVDAMREAIEEERHVSVEIRNYRKDGTKFWNQVDIAPLKDENNEVTNFVGFQKDITEQKEYEHELQRFKKGVESSNYAIYMTDRDGTIEYVNPSFKDVTGYSKEEAIGKMPSIMKSGEMDEEYYDEMWSTLLSGEIWREEIVNRRKSGELYTAVQTISPIKNGNGDEDIIGFVAVQRDITESRSRRQRLHVVNRMIRHNLRNKLNIVTGYTDLMLEDVEDPEMRNYLEKIDKNATKLLEESEKLRRFQDFVESSKTWSSNQIEIKDLMERLVGETENEYPEAEIDAEFRDVDGVTVDSSVRFALEELIENGVVHNDSDSPQVYITVSMVEDGFMDVSVSDNGPGISDQEREVFDIGEETPLEHGSGIGLWVVHWVVNNLGGKVTINEDLENGATIDLKIPS